MSEFEMFKEQAEKTEASLREKIKEQEVSFTLGFLRCHNRKQWLLTVCFPTLRKKPYTNEQKRKP